MEAKGLAIALALEKDGDRIARRTLEQLVRRGLLQSSMEVGPQGRTKWFWPVDTDPPAEARTPTCGDTYTLTEVSEPSYPLPDQIDPFPTTKKTKDTSDRKDRKKPITREECPDVSAPTTADLAAAPDRFSCLVNGETGWSRKAGPMPRLSVFVSHLDGRQLSAGPDQVKDLPPAC